MGLKLGQLLETNGGRLTVQVLVDHGMTENQAEGVLQRLWLNGTLAPMTTSFFAPRNSDGSLPRLVRVAISDEHREAIEALPQQAFTVREIEALTELSTNIVRRTLQRLEIERVWVSKPASVGGIYGNRPRLWARTPAQLEARDREMAKAYQPKKGRMKPADEKPVKSTRVSATQFERYEDYINYHVDQGIDPSTLVNRRTFKKVNGET